MTELTAGAAPQFRTFEGRYCRLEPLAPNHAPSFFAAVSGEGIEQRYKYLFSHPPKDAEELATAIARIARQSDPMFFAVIDRTNGQCGGQQALMRVRPEHRSIEIGSILWGRGIAKTRLATEALFLFAHYVFEELGYRRFEWKCNAQNMPSRRAAQRFGFRFEGIFRQDMIVKGQNRDTAWFSILDSEWADLKPLYEAWLDPDNFDSAGKARSTLGTVREP